MTPSVYVAVDTAAIQHNVSQVIGRIGAAQLLAVVKGNGYGHGAALAARACLDAGASWLGVSAVAEGLALREAGLTAPILIFLPPLEDECEPLVAAELCATVTHQEHLAWLRRAAEATGKVSQVQIFLDSGLARPGAGDDLPELIDLAAHFPHQKLLGLYTHIDCSRGVPRGEALDIMKRGTQLEVFAGLMKAAARDAGAVEPMFHAAASPMVCDQPESCLDMARVGTLLYGQYPGHVQNQPFDLRNTFEFRARILDITEHTKGTRVGYGGEFVCARRTLVATLPVGYAHGLGVGPASVLSRPQNAVREWQRKSRAARGRGPGDAATVGGQQALLIGRIAMDQCCLDVTDVPGVVVGDEAVLPVRRLSVSAAVPRVAVTAGADGVIQHSSGPE
jgi:alanine racemase